MFYISLRDWYYKLEDKWFRGIDYLDRKRVPAYGLIDPLERRGIPSLPIYIAILMIILYIALTPMLGVGGPLIGPGKPRKVPVTIQVQNQDGEPLPTAKVELESIKEETTQEIATGQKIMLRTGTSGEIKENITPGTYKVKAQKYQYNSTTKQITIEEDPLTVTLTLTSETTQLQTTPCFSPSISTRNLEITEYKTEGEKTGEAPSLQNFFQQYKENYSYKFQTPEYKSNQIKGSEVPKPTDTCISLEEITPTTQKGKVSVKLLNENKKPLPYQEVRLVEPEDTETNIVDPQVTKENGITEFTGSIGDEFRVFIPAQGKGMSDLSNKTYEFKEESQTITRTINQTAETTIVAKHEKKLIEGAYIKAYTPKGKLHTTGYTSESGSISFGGKKGEKYLATFYKKGYKPRKIQIKGGKKRVVELTTIQEIDTGEVKAKVKNKITKRREKGINVKIKKLNNQSNPQPTPYPNQHTDKDGVAKFDWVMPGEYCLSAKREGKRPTKCVDNTITVEANVKTVKEILIEPLTYNLEVKVLKPNGEGAREANVKILNWKQEEIKSDTTGPRGGADFTVTGKKLITLIATYKGKYREQRPEFLLKKDLVGKDHVPIQLHKTNTSITYEGTYKTSEATGDKFKEALESGNTYWFKYAVGLPNISGKRWNEINLHWSFSGKTAEIPGKKLFYNLPEGIRGKKSETIKGSATDRELIINDPYTPTNTTINIMVPIKIPSDIKGTQQNQIQYHGKWTKEIIKRDPSTSEKTFSFNTTESNIKPPDEEMNLSFDLKIKKNERTYNPNEIEIPVGEEAKFLVDVTNNEKNTTMYQKVKIKDIGELLKFKNVTNEVPARITTGDITENKAIINFDSTTNLRSLPPGNTTTIKITAEATGPLTGTGALQANHSTGKENVFRYKTRKGKEEKIKIEKWIKNESGIYKPDEFNVTTGKNITLILNATNNKNKPYTGDIEIKDNPDSPLSSYTTFTKVRNYDQEGNRTRWEDTSLGPNQHTARVNFDEQQPLPVQETTTMKVEATTQKVGKPANILAEIQGKPGATPYTFTIRYKPGEKPNVTTKKWIKYNDTLYQGNIRELEVKRNEDIKLIVNTTNTGSTNIQDPLKIEDKYHSNSGKQSYTNFTSVKNYENGKKTRTTAITSETHLAIVNFQKEPLKPGKTTKTVIEAVTKNSGNATIPIKPPKGKLGDHNLVFNITEKKEEKPGENITITRIIDGEIYSHNKNYLRAKGQSFTLKVNATSKKDEKITGKLRIGSKNKDKYKFTEVESWKYFENGGREYNRVESTGSDTKAVINYNGKKNLEPGKTSETTLHSKITKGGDEAFIPIRKVTETNFPYKKQKPFFINVTENDVKFYTRIRVKNTSTGEFSIPADSTTVTPKDEVKLTLEMKNTGEAPLIGGNLEIKDWGENLKFEEISDPQTFLKLKEWNSSYANFSFVLPFQGRKKITTIKANITEGGPARADVNLSRDGSTAFEFGVEGSRGTAWADIGNYGKNKGNTIYPLSTSKDISIRNETHHIITQSYIKALNLSGEGIGEAEGECYLNLNYPPVKKATLIGGDKAEYRVSFFHRKNNGCKLDTNLNQEISYCKTGDECEYPETKTCSSSSSETYHCEKGNSHSCTNKNQYRCQEILDTYQPHSKKDQKDIKCAKEQYCDPGDKCKQEQKFDYKCIETDKYDAATDYGGETCGEESQQGEYQADPSYQGKKCSTSTSKNITITPIPGSNSPYLMESAQATIKPCLQLPRKPINIELKGGKGTKEKKLGFNIPRKCSYTTDNAEMNLKATLQGKGLENIKLEKSNCELTSQKGTCKFKISTGKTQEIEGIRKGKIKFNLTMTKTEERSIIQINRIWSRSLNIRREDEQQPIGKYLFPLSIQRYGSTKTNCNSKYCTLELLIEKIKPFLNPQVKLNKEKIFKAKLVNQRMSTPNLQSHLEKVLPEEEEESWWEKNRVICTSFEGKKHSNCDLLLKEPKSISIPGHGKYKINISKDENPEGQPLTILKITPISSPKELHVKKFQALLPMDSRDKFSNDLRLQTGYPKGYIDTIRTLIEKQYGEKPSTEEPISAKNQVVVKPGTGNNTIQVKGEKKDATLKIQGPDPQAIIDNLTLFVDPDKDPTALFKRISDKKAVMTKEIPVIGINTSKNYKDLKPSIKIFTEGFIPLQNTDNITYEKTTIPKSTIVVANCEEGKCEDYIYQFNQEILQGQDIKVTSREDFPKEPIAIKDSTGLYIFAKTLGAKSILKNWENPQGLEKTGNLMYGKTKITPEELSTKIKEESSFSRIHHLKDVKNPAWSPPTQLERKGNFPMQTNNDYLIIKSPEIIYAQKLTAKKGKTLIAGNIKSCIDITHKGEWNITKDITDGTQSGKDHCLKIEADNVVLNGKGNKITGEGLDSGTTAIKIQETKNVKIKNVKINKYGNGIKIQNSKSTEVTKNKINSKNGVTLTEKSTKNIIKKNTLTGKSKGSGTGIEQTEKENGDINITIDDNTIKKYETGIHLEKLNNSLINKTSTNKLGTGIKIKDSSQTVISNNNLCGTEGNSLKVTKDNNKITGSNNCYKKSIKGGNSVDCSKGNCGYSQYYKDKDKDGCWTAKKFQKSKPDPARNWIKGDTYGPMAPRKGDPDPDHKVTKGKIDGRYMLEYLFNKDYDKNSDELYDEDDFTLNDDLGLCNTLWSMSAIDNHMWGRNGKDKWQDPGDDDYAAAYPHSPSEVVFINAESAVSWGSGETAYKGAFLAERNPGEISKSFHSPGDLDFDKESGDEDDGGHNETELYPCDDGKIVDSFGCRLNFGGEHGVRGDADDPSDGDRADCWLKNPSTIKMRCQETDASSAGRAEASCTLKYTCKEYDASKEKYDAYVNSTTGTGDGVNKILCKEGYHVGAMGTILVGEGSTHDYPAVGGEPAPKSVKGPKRWRSVLVERDNWDSQDKWKVTVLCEKNWWDSSQQNGGNGGTSGPQ